MANRKFLIESILGLAQKIGANPSKFMGTKGNVSFLGTGDRAMKDTTFSGALNKNFLELGVTKDDLIKVIEKDAGYVTADKLNDMQLKTMYDNLTMVDSKINPIQNIVKFPEGGINSIPVNKQFGGEGITSLRSSPMKKSTNGVRLYGDESFDELLIIDKTGVHPRNKAEGGRIGYSGGKSVTDIQLKEMLNAEPPFDAGKYLGRAADYKRSPFAIPDNWVEKIMEYLKRDKKANGGRIGYRSGKSVTGIMNLIKSKFGKDSIKVADEVDSSAFYKSPLRSKKQMTDDEIQAFADEFGIDPTEDYYNFDGTFGSANKIFKEDKAYKAEMYDQYITGKLDPEAGSLSQGRLNLLKQRAEEAEATKDYRLFGEDEADELKYLEDYFEKDYLNFKAQQTDRKITQEEIERLKELNEKFFAKGGLARILEM